jgi:hypothetical protein
METWDEAHCEELLKEDPTNYLAYFRLAGICFERADSVGAKNNLLRVSELAPDFNTEKVNLALSQMF